jgi:hypothetical protein
MAKTINIELKAPQSWSELTQEQLRYVFYLMATFADMTVVKTYMFVRFTGISVIEKNRYGWKCAYKPEGEKLKVFYIEAWQIHSFLKQLSWVDSTEDMDNRLDVVQGLQAVHPLLQEDTEHKRIISFGEYLCMEQQYQLFHETKKQEHIDKLASFLYRKPDFSRPDELSLTIEESLATIAWFANIKLVMSRAFPNFFRKATADDVTELSVLQSINLQLRALTDGDVTKEAEVKRVDCWRALTELDAKAKEAEDFRRKYPDLNK